ncbi:hydroxyacid dehydrogenase [Campylobacter sp. MIT 12-8780]|uniref:virulence RhuM family protein n=1 Tax=unclassified Campylobacter TaxID=2593542 RepID=UPI00115CDEFE|nr:MULTISPECIES: virulence RhuM family protein [unclassified Campylobacter]NDJ27635.1 virulence RhuM family protein [Campylobacter sp. MIT 19-121]TQR40802.1 hydroxyacid dehydrogenase [Campylobacter sp. MIT 12-8780]
MHPPIIYITKDGKTQVELYELGSSVWLSQNDMAKLFATSTQNITMHIRNILKDGELSEISVCKDYLHTATDSKQYKIKIYSLEMILAVGFRVRSKRGVQFRIWANENLRHYLQKGFIIDTDRLKNPNGRTDYFDELLEQIRDIRASEKRFYQKVRDLFALSVDYDTSDKTTQMFFANTQNKLLFAITGQSAAELICTRADENALNMGLTSFKGNVVRKGDIIIAKNYLNKDELDSLNRLVNVFLESAELRVKSKQVLTMDFWRENVDTLLKFQGLEILKGNGSISNEQMKNIVIPKYEIFDEKRKREQALEADKDDENILEAEYKALSDRTKENK